MILSSIACSMNELPTSVTSYKKKLPRKAEENQGKTTKRNTKAKQKQKYEGSKTETYYN